MNISVRQTSYNEIPDPSMKGPLITSAVFHVGLFLLTLVSLPFISRNDTIISTPISIEVVEIDKITQTNKPKAPKPKEDEPIKEEKAPPPIEKPEPPPLKETAPPELEKPKPPDKPIEKPKAEKPKDKPKPKPEPKKEETKTENKDFQNLLKNLTPVEPQQKPLDEVLETVENANPEESFEAPLGERLTMSEEDALRHQVTPCWNVPAGAKFAENLAVEIRVFMNRDGTISNATILDTGRYNQDTAFRAAADSARRALQNPRCQPFKFPPEKI